LKRERRKRDGREGIVGEKKKDRVGKRGASWSLPEQGIGDRAYGPNVGKVVGGRQSRRKTKWKVLLIGYNGEKRKDQGLASGTGNGDGGGPKFKGGVDLPICRRAAQVRHHPTGGRGKRDSATRGKARGALRSGAGPKLAKTNSSRREIIRGNVYGWGGLGSSLKPTDTRAAKELHREVVLGWTLQLLL